MRDERNELVLDALRLTLLGDVAKSVQSAKVAIIAVRHRRRVNLQVADLGVVLLDREARNLIGTLICLIEIPTKLVRLVEDAVDDAVERG